eukprot:TRINITY_DN9716_c0_g1_i1.p2 TRINITY_DN9716_c0_g1~~TRINITY_DN9716_c0_g1_i1.p2  ORF type:complete len:110 (+),score=0.71 TRINITY_DN9716_c0_g1_i1:162-491(+)
MTSGSKSSITENVLVRTGPMLFAAFVMLPIFVVDLCKFSHRFVGPLIRLRKGLQQLADGKSVQPIKLRKHDFWQSTIDDFNRVIDSATHQKEEDDSHQEQTAREVEVAV